jgi:hypothetical protein
MGYSKKFFVLVVCVLTPRQISFAYIYENFCILRYSIYTGVSLLYYFLPYGFCTSKRFKKFTWLCNPVNPPQKVTTIRKYQVLSSHSEKKSRPTDQQQQQFSINSWTGILCPQSLPAQVSGYDYLNFLQTYLSGLVEDVSYITHVHMFQRDGVSPHNSCEVHPWLSENCPGCSIRCRREAPVSWLHAHITTILLIFCMGIFENQGLCQYSRY